ncbi:hypothetical protein CCZ01_08670 [Helicobacter monodelphidis]|nr:hypothetical protein CCZ01_08670 [Helicobacter sp. 15-1451]
MPFMWAFIAFVALIVVRLFWLDYAMQDSFLFEGAPIIGNNDGYFYAEGARDIIAGFHQENDLSPIHSPLSILTAFIAQTTGIPLSWLMLLMPVFCGSLIAFPIFFITLHFIQQSKIDFLKPDIPYFGALNAAIFGGLCVSYYNRTALGYFDTDMLILPLVLSFYYFIFKYFLNNNSTHHLRPISLFLMGIFGILSVYWHHGIQNIFLLFFIILLIFTFISTFYFYSIKKEKSFRFLKYLDIISITSLTLIIPHFVPLCFALLFYILCTHFLLKWPKLLYSFIVLFIICILGVAFYTSFDLLHSLFKIYILHELPTQSEFIFWNVLTTINEVSAIDYPTLFKRVSSHIIIFIFSIIGLFLLIVKYPCFILTIPFIFLGLAGIEWGLRFNIFAVPFLAITFSFFLSYILSYVSHSNIRIPLFIFLFSLCLYPSIQHIQQYRYFSLYNPQELTLLSHLKTLANREDYVVAWWDYGYAIRYYGDTKTLIDGGKHDGSINFLVSYMLVQPLFPSLNLAYITSEFTEQIFQKNLPNNQIVDYIFKYYQLDKTHPNLSLDTLLQNKEIQLPEKSQDIYYYIPLRMFKLLPSIENFSNIHLSSGEPLKNSFYFFSELLQEKEEKLYLKNYRTGKDIAIIDLQKGLLIKDEKIEIPIKEILIITEEKMNHSFIHTQPNINKRSFFEQSNLYVIYLKEQSSAFLLDSNSFQSTALQLFLNTENAQKYFQLVASNPTGRIYKLIHERKN